MMALRDQLLELFKRDIESSDQESPWYVRIVTWPLSLLFSVLVRMRLFSYDLRIRRTLALPGVTISIGNIAVGGTGKSPMVMEVVRILTSHQGRCVILTRGYGSRLGPKDFMIVRNGTVIFSSDPSASMPDEARMQSANLPDTPVVIGRDRWRAATSAVRQGLIAPPTHWVLDDGFQHRRLARHLDIVLLDAERPFGNTHLLPRGNLREPRSSLRRAGTVILTRAKSPDPEPETLKIIRSYFQGAVLAVPFKSQLCLTAIGDKKIMFDVSKHSPLVVVCGIARPQLFVADIERQGLKIKSTYFVPDHHHFDREILLKHAHHANSIVTTEKDYYRDPALFADLDCPVFIQSLSLDLKSEELSTLLSSYFRKNT
jgi:tetraacyldisaccharide 4'-kinase